MRNTSRFFRLNRKLLNPRAILMRPPIRQRQRSSRFCIRRVASRFDTYIPVKRGLWSLMPEQANGHMVVSNAFESQTKRNKRTLSTGRNYWECWEQCSVHDIMTRFSHPQEASRDERLRGQVGSIERALDQEAECSDVLHNLLG